MKLSEVKKEIRGVFKQPKKRYYFGKTHYGSPYFHPWNYNSSIIKIYKNPPKYISNKHFKLFGYTIEFGSPVWFRNVELGWKDKFNSPRYEWGPSFVLYFFGLQFCIFWESPGDKTNDEYWEQILWWLYYSDKDVKKAKETWGWVDMKTKQSTWNDNLLIKNDGK